MAQQLHFLLIPLMAQGHMIPMLDIARLLSQRGVIVTVVLTPLNNLRFKPTIDRAARSGLPICILQLRFPGVEAGLPEGCENLDNVPSRDLATNFFLAASMLQEPLENAVGQMEVMPSCMISDFYLPWTSKTSGKFDIPRLIFHGTSCFNLLCCRNIICHKTHQSVHSDSEPFAIPDLPDHVQITRRLLPGHVNKLQNDTRDLNEQVNDSERLAYGIVVNSFHDLEGAYIDNYHKSKQGKAWCVGPVSLCNEQVLDKSERGNKSSIDKNQCLKWLDSRPENSVVYVCLGSLCRLIPAQLLEIGLGLEASDCSFIWVIRETDIYEGLDKWSREDGFEERTKDRGLLIKGWAPQVLILSHQAIGGFVTHCGWNSSLEGISAGVPMMTWPMFSDQFLNEKLLVEVLKIGISLGVCEPVNWGEEENAGVLVKKEQIVKGVKLLMDQGSKGEERRRRVRELAEMGKKAMEVNGSSYLSITMLIQDIRDFGSKKETVKHGVR
ncbi:UDP-glycosyltransferase [Ranunculus cassubicifolius]